MLDKKFIAACGVEDDEVDLEELKRLLAAGADINTRNIWGSTCLMRTAREGNLEVSKFLVDHNADVDMKSSSGRTALQLASDNGHTGVVSLLLEAADSNILYE